MFSTPGDSRTWLVGLPCRSDGSRIVWLYYVVGEAPDSAEALCAAVRLANSARERDARGQVPVELDRAEVQRIRQHILGDYVLEAC
ncbi:hypothetical protein RKD19_008181 [Streptomyces canus]|uniref:hypothetical protein n=1 Tax=unclassified Streptomyces TaxID=2593676 RepID=UPI000F65210F|nr:hypothetical protein [Streptomyces sp. RP5T]RRR87105.1 hypothetical protein EHS43_02155 [Streptomyces sp. RP5T]